jgi:hypothetical protein
MSDHKQNLTDLAAMFAMAGIIMRGDDSMNYHAIATEAYDLAEQLMIVREHRGGGVDDDELNDDEGIAAIKPKRTRRGGK